MEWGTGNTAGIWLTKASLHWRVLSLMLVSVLQSERCKRQIVQDSMPIQIQLPEGTYDATATFEQFTWWRPFRRSTRTKLYTQVEVPDGIPYVRSGERHSLFGYSVEGHDLARATARGAEIALKGREQIVHDTFRKPSVSSM